MIEKILSVLNDIWKIGKVFFIPLILLVFYYIISILFFTCYWRGKGVKRKKGCHNIIKRPSLLSNIFALPKQIALDRLRFNPSYFKHQGCIIFTGRQGMGKTIALVEQADNWLKEYPKAKCIGNLSYKCQDDELDDWRKLIDYKNGIYGVIALIDETQNWFSSNQSKNFPPEMLEVITQNRKNRRVILGTAQSFNRLSKPIREQATEVRKCITLFGCLTIVHRVIPELDANGDVKEWKHRGFYYFVQNNDLRNKYDTYKVIESLRKSDFQDLNNSYITVQNNIINTLKNKKIK